MQSIAFKNNSTLISKINEKKKVYFQTLFVIFKRSPDVSGVGRSTAILRKLLANSFNLPFSDSLIVPIELKIRFAVNSR